MAFVRTSLRVVDPEIDPEIVALPATVVTVQSPVCAEGVPSVASDRI